MAAQCHLDIPQRGLADRTSDRIRGASGLIRGISSGLPHRAQRRAISIPTKTRSNLAFGRLVANANQGQTVASFFGAVILSDHG